MLELHFKDIAFVLQTNDVVTDSMSIDFKLYLI